jgi:hypothetical protein
MWAVKHSQLWKETLAGRTMVASSTLAILLVWRDKTPASAIDMAFMWVIKHSQLWKETLAGRIRIAASPTLTILLVWRDKTSAPTMR